MENNKKVSFDNIKLLNSFLTQGKFSALIGNIKNLKVKMDTLCKDARAREKQLLANIEAEKIKEQRTQELFLTRLRMVSTMTSSRLWHVPVDVSTVAVSRLLMQRQRLLLILRLSVQRHSIRKTASLQSVSPMKIR